MVLGHSLGEYAAACLAGVFSLEDALRLVTTRARLVGQLETSGQMLVVLAPHETVRALLPESLDIAAINGPRQTVVAGRADEVPAPADPARRAPDPLPELGHHARLPLGRWSSRSCRPLAKWHSKSATLRPSGD